MYVRSSTALCSVLIAVSATACSSRALIVAEEYGGSPTGYNSGSRAPAELVYPSLSETNVLAVIGRGSERRVVLQVDMAPSETGWETPECWTRGSADYTATQGCEQYVAAGEQLGSLPLANQPAAVALITNAGWCIPTLGEPTLYNTAVCENGFNVGLPISGCDDAAPIAVVIDSPEVVAGWHELYWAPVSFSDQRDVDLETAINDEQLPTEVRTWWRLVSDLFQYRDNELQTAARTGTAQTGSTSWINLSVALHVEGTEECDDTIATHDGLYIDSTEGLRTTSVSPIVSDFVYSADLSELFGVYVGDSWVDLSKRDANGSFVEQFRLRHRLDNEECASWPGRVRLEYNCGP